MPYLKARCSYRDRLALVSSLFPYTTLFRSLPFVLGLATGIILFSRILTWLLKRYHTLTLVFFTGFLIGSIHILWPFQERVYEETEQGREIYSYHDPSIQALLERDEIGRAHV